MINPNMATMLAFIMLDVSISQKMLNELIKQVVAKSFNLITVDGDTSTNDSLVIASSNKAANEVIKTKNKYYFELEKHLIVIAKTLAQAIVRDGEGATKFVEIEIKNAKNISEVSTIGKVIANSPLVKTAFFASDPNLGRILAAIGNVGSINFDPGKIDIKLNNSIVIRNGQLAKSYSEEKAFLAMKKKEFKLSINLKRGSVTESVFTTDFSYDYVKINAEYRS
jgi:glutamate N-acetyltransferase/amino-acid N-acetyltransferase